MASNLKSIFTNGPALGITLAGTLLLKNQQRDYLDTAAMVAPLAYGGAMLYNSMGRTAASTAGHVFKAVSEAASQNPVEEAIKQNHSYNSMRSVFKDRGASKSALHDAISGYMRQSNKKVRDVGKELESFTKFLNKNFLFDTDMKDMVMDFVNNPSKAIPKAGKNISKAQVSKLRQAKNIARNYSERRQLVSNAVIGAMFDSSSPSDLLKIRGSKQGFKSMYMGKGESFTGTHISQLSSVLDKTYLATIGEKSSNGTLEGLPLPEFNEVLGKLTSTLSDRPSFVKSARARLTQAKYLKDPESTSVSYADFFKAESKGSYDAANKENKLVYQQLENFDGEGIADYKQIVANLNEGKKGVKPRIADALVVSEKVADGKVPLGIDIRYNEEGRKELSSFFVPFQNHGGASRSPTRNSYVVRDVINDAGERVNLARFVSETIAYRGDIPLKDIHGDAGALAYWQGLDPRLNRREGAGLDYDALQTNRMARVRSYSASFSSLPVYNNGDTMVGFDRLPGAIKTDKILEQTKSNGSLMPLGSESGVYEGVLQDVILEKLHPFQLHSMEKQESTYRALSKNMELISGDDSNQFFTNKNYEEITGSSQIPETGVRVANIAPEDKALFNSLPSSLEEFDSKQEDIRKQFGVSEDNWDKLRREIRTDYVTNNGDSLKQFGRMGETEFLLDPEFAGKHKIGTSLAYELDHISTSVGQKVAKGDILGWNQNTAVRAAADGTITSNFSAGDDKSSFFKMTVAHELDMNGAKVDVNGVKGQGFVTNSLNRMRDLMNSLYEARGSEDYIPEGVNAFADMTYNVNKTDIASQHQSLLGDVIRSAFNGPDADVMSGIEAVTPARNSKLKWSDVEEPSIFQHYTFDGNTIALNTENLSTNRITRSQQIEEIFQLGQEVIKKANDRIHQKLEQGHVFTTPLFEGFAKSGSSNLESWALKNYQPAMMRAWNHTSLFAAKNLSLTYDMETFAAMNGNFAAVKELRDRRVAYGGGSISQAEDFAKHIIDPANNPLANVYDAKKAFTGVRGSLTDPAVRQGSIFDSSLEQYKDNFQLDLGDGGKHRYVPVLGHGAYQGTSPNYTQENQQAREYQRQVKEITETKDIAKRDKLVDELYSTYKSDLITGKGSVLRPYSYDPNGVTGFLRTNTTKDTFDVTIGKDVLDTIHDTKMKNSLLAGEHTYGMFWRQPISDAMHVRVKYDPSLTGGRGIGASERLYRVLQGDADEDPVGISLWKKGTDAYQEAEQVINSGIQHKNLDTFYDLYGTEEDSLTIKSSKLKAMTDRFFGTADKKGYIETARSPERTIQNRTAGGAIGAFSNELSGIMEAVAADSDIVRDSDKAFRLKHFLFNNIRQVPINARKSHSAYDMSDAIGHVKALSEAFSNGDEDTAFSQIHGVMSQLTQVKTGAGKANPAFDYLQSEVGESDIRGLLRSRSEASTVRTQVLLGRGKIDELLESVKRIGFEKVGGTLHGYASAAAASAQGRMNEELTNAARATRNSFRDFSRAFRENHGKHALVALGAVAALGLMTSSNRNVAGINANKFRPEDTAGVLDRVPGDPVIGSQASNPPRNVIRPQGVNTAVVAPLNNAVDTNVKLRAKDNTDSVEMAKAMSRLTNNGNQHVNINYTRDPRIGSLRFKERLQDMRDS